MMSEIDAANKLKNTGLLVEAVGEIHPYANGYSIIKLKQTPGNSREDWESFVDIKTSSGVKEVPSDAPGSHLYPKNGKWIFQVWEYIPGPGPGDFQDEFTSINDAVPAVIDYYFGDSSKMNPPELLEEKP